MATAHLIYRPLLDYACSFRCLVCYIERLDPPWRPESGFTGCSLASPDAWLTIIVLALTGAAAHFAPGMSDGARTTIVAIQVGITFFIVWKLAAGYSLYGHLPTPSGLRRRYGCVVSMPGKVPNEARGTAEVFAVESDSGRNRGTQTRENMKPSPPPRTFPQRRGGAVTVPAYVMLCLLLVIPAWALSRLAPRIDWRVLVGAPVALSMFTFLAYRSDKRRAEAGEWRISESTLHIAELVGGWPGAFLAQRKFRHKISKTSYQFAFWTVVLLQWNPLRSIPWSIGNGPNMWSTSSGPKPPDNGWRQTSSRFRFELGKSH